MKNSKLMLGIQPIFNFSEACCKVEGKFKLVKAAVTLVGIYN